MPLYEDVCPVCQTTFERIRPWSQADDPVTCPQGHEGAKRRVGGSFMAQGKDSYGVTTTVSGTRPRARPGREKPFIV